MASEYINELGSTIEEVEGERADYILDMISINDPAENENFVKHRARINCSTEEQKQVEKLLRDIRMSYVKIANILAKYRG